MSCSKSSGVGSRELSGRPSPNVIDRPSRRPLPHSLAPSWKVSYDGLSEAVSTVIVGPCVATLLGRGADSLIQTLYSLIQECE